MKGTVGAREGEGLTAGVVRLPRPRAWGVAWRLFVTCWVIYALHFATNTVREIYPALSLGDRGSFDVSEYLGLHPDIFEMPGRGVFINNNPGASILAAVPYALARPAIDAIVTRVQAARAAGTSPPPEYRSIYPMAREFYREARARGLDVKFGLAAAVMQSLLMAPLSAASAVVMFYLLLSLTRSTRAALLLALLYAFATPVFFRTGQLNHNLLVGHATLFAFALLWQPWAPRRVPGPGSYLLAGLLCGWAVVLDYSGVVVVAVLGLYALARLLPWSALRRQWRAGLVFGVGVAMSSTVLLAYQWLAFGHPLYPAQRYMPATPYSGLGYNGMDWPQLDLLWDTAFGLHFGLFTSAPLLLVALAVPIWLRGRGRLLASRELWCCVGLTVVFFLFAAANQYGRLQFNSGVRYVVPVVPFVFLLAAGVLLALPRPLAIVLAVVTTYWSWCLAMYRDVEQPLGVLDPLVHVTLEGLRLPWLTTLERLGYVPMGTSPLPLLLLVALGLWALWCRHGPAWDRPASPPAA